MSVSFVEKPSRDEFAKLVIEAADRAGIAGIKYDQKDFTLWYKCSGGTAGLFLGNFYAEYCQADSAAGTDLVMGRWLYGMQGVKSSPAKLASFEEARPKLLAVVKNRVTLAEPTLGWQLDRSKPGFKIRFEPISRWFGRCAVLDFPRHLTFVTEGDLKTWCASFDEVFSIGLAKLRKSTKPDFRFENGFFAGKWTDSYANSRILLPQLFAGLRLSGNPVVCLPNTQTLLVTGSQDHTGIRRMLMRSAEIARNEPRPDSPAPLILKHGRIEDFAVPADSPLYEAVEFARKDAEYLCYQRQKESLDVLYAKHEKDIFVASSHLATPNEGEDGECFSYAVWSKGVHALLPKLDKIAFNDPGAPESHRLLAMARWEDVAALLGDMLQDTHMFPERFFVSEFPSDQQLETLRRMQTDSRPQPALK